LRKNQLRVSSQNHYANTYDKFLLLAA